MKRTVMFLATAICIAIGAVPASAEVGVTDDMIKFGTFQDMSGPGAYLGKMCTTGLTVWKKWVNEKLGGIHGRQVDFVVEDMKYDPVLTKTAFTKLVNQHQVFSIIMVYGSTPCTAVKEDIKKEKIPVFTTAASVASMYDPPNRYLFWYACNDEDNAIMMVDYVMNDLKAEKPKFGVCYQDDEWGKSALSGLEIAAKKYGLNYAAAPYKRGEKEPELPGHEIEGQGRHPLLLRGIRSGLRRASPGSEQDRMEAHLLRRLRDRGPEDLHGRRTRRRALPLLQPGHAARTGQGLEGNGRAVHLGPRRRTS